MSTQLFTLPVYRKAPSFRTDDRRNTDWSLMTSETLWFAYQLLSLHQSPFIGMLLDEIDRRETLGNAIDLDNPPPPLENMPKWLKSFPFTLLWTRRYRVGEWFRTEKEEK